MLECPPDLAQDNLLKDALGRNFATKTLTDLVRVLLLAELKHLEGLLGGFHTAEGHGTKGRA